MFWSLSVPPTSGPDVIMTSLCRHNWTMEAKTIPETEDHMDFNSA
jgi:hypothetical protein